MSFEMSMSPIVPMDERNFCPIAIRESLENDEGIIRMDSGKNFANKESASKWFIQFCKKIGTPLSQSSEGDLVLSVKDESFGHKDPRTRGPNTSNKLSFHSDRCDVIAFLCLCPAKKGGENQIVQSFKVKEIIKEERPDLLKILEAKFPYKRHVVDLANKRPYVMQPIFSLKDNFFACSYLRVLIDRADSDEKCPNLSKIQKEALDFLDEICERPSIQQRFTMQKGELLLLNNWILLHRRTAFEDYLEQHKKRHLLRIWLSVPNSRPIDEAFIENYGSNLAGAVRGGFMKLPT